jgi:hypothetical protein
VKKLRQEHERLTRWGIWRTETYDDTPMFM